MQPDRDTNQHGCPYTFQSGQAAIQGFEQVLKRLAPELRAAFECERAERQHELNRILAANACHS